MDGVVKGGSRARMASTRGGKPSMRRILFSGFILLAMAATVLPASIAGAQSQYLESVDLLYRNYAMTTTYIEDRLAGDFLDVMMRVDAGELERHTISGAYAPAAAGSPEGEANGFYVALHSASVEVDDNSPTGYEGDTTGVSVGYERWIGNTLYALNLSSMKADVDFTGTGFDDATEDQDMLSLGIHVMGTYHDNWTWRGRIAGFMTDHDYEGTTGDALDIWESAAYESTGLNASGMAGYLFRLGGARGVLLPEIGGEYLYTQRDSFTTEADSEAWNMTARHFYDNQVTGVASLRWTTRARLLNIDLVPSVAMGVRMLLSDEKIHEVQTIGEASTGIVNEQENLTKTLSASLLMHITGHLQASLSYDGGFGDDATQHLLAFRMYFPF